MLHKDGVLMTEQWRERKGGGIKHFIFSPSRYQKKTRSMHALLCFIHDSCHESRIITAT